MTETTHVEQTRQHDATVRGLTTAFTAIGTPGIGRYDAALGMAAAIQVLRHHSRAPDALQLRDRQRDGLVKSLQAAQRTMHAEFGDVLPLDDMLISIRACGVLIFNWASPSRAQTSTGEAMIEVDEIAAALHHVLMATAIFEAVNAKSSRRAAARKELFDSLLAVGAQRELQS